MIELKVFGVGTSLRKYWESIEAEMSVITDKTLIYTALALVGTIAVVFFSSP